MDNNYKSPPIVEAVIELRFSENVPFEKLDKRKQKFERYYPQIENLLDITAEFSPINQSIRHQPTGFRFRSKDELEVLSLQAGLVVFGQLAPYPGWPVFLQRMLRDLDIIEDNFGRRGLTRIGIRFINRIDVPLTLVNVTDYLRIYPVLPELEGSVGAKFAVEATANLKDRRYAVTFRSGLTEPPVPQMLSFALDIDLFRTVELPTRRDHLIEVLTEMRQIKNEVFEASVTDQARKLFN